MTDKTAATHNHQSGIGARSFAAYDHSADIVASIVALMRQCEANKLEFLDLLNEARRVVRKK